MTSEFYADWGSYDVRITVPKTFQVASTGEEQGPPIENGDLVTRRFAQGDVHDFAWMAASDFAPPLEGIYEGPGSPKVKVKVFYPPEFVASAAPALAATIDSLRWFSQALGPYPYRTSTCIIPPFNAGGAGGMEYQTLFTSDGTSVVDPGTLAASLLDLTTIHELGHGYFYGILATNEFEEPFLDEGLDDYWDIRMLDARMQVVHMGTPFWKRLGIDPTAGGFVLEREEGALDPHPADALGQNSWDRHSTQSYREVYHRTSTVLHDLEARLGRDVTDRAFRMFYEKWRFRHPSTADLREALVAASTDRRAVEQVFHQSIYGSEPIDDRVESIISTEELPRAGTSFVDGKWVEKTEQAVKKEIDEARERWKISHSGAAHGEGPYSYRTTVTVRRDGASVPQTLVVTFEDGAIETVRWDDERRWNTFVFVKPVKAKSAELDPAREILLDHDKLNDGRSVEPSPAASRRWAGEAWSFFDLLCSLLGTI
jgi:hypothetical protein